jgi:hypothetical protein
MAGARGATRLPRSPVPTQRKTAPGRRRDAQRLFTRPSRKSPCRSATIGELRLSGPYRGSSLQQRPGAHPPAFSCPSAAGPDTEQARDDVARGRVMDPLTAEDHYGCR